MIHDVNFYTSQWSFIHLLIPQFLNNASVCIIGLSSSNLRWTCILNVHNNKGNIFVNKSRNTTQNTLKWIFFQSLCYFLYLYRPKTESMPTSWHVMLRRERKKTSQVWRKSPRMLSLMEVSFRGILWDSKGGHCV